MCGRGWIARQVELPQTWQWKTALDWKTSRLFINKNLPLLAEAFWKYCWVRFDQDPCPVVLQFKEQSVGVRLEIVRAGLDEETPLQLWKYETLVIRVFIYYLPSEKDLVYVSRLAVLAPGVDLLDRDGEVVGQGGRRPQVVFGKSIAQKFCLLFKAVEVRPRKDAVIRLFCIFGRESCSPDKNFSWNPLLLFVYNLICVNHNVHQCDKLKYI